MRNQYRIRKMLTLLFTIAGLSACVIGCSKETETSSGPRDSGETAMTEAGEKDFDMSGGEELTEEMATEGEEAGALGMVNPWTDCTDLDQAVEISDVPLSQIPEVEGFEETRIRAMLDLLEVLYLDSEGQEMLRFRKGVFSEGGVSGDYNSYPVVEYDVYQGKKIRIFGDGETASLAVWDSEEADGSVYSYAARTSDSGFTSEEMLKDVKQLIRGEKAVLSSETETETAS